MVHFSGLLSLLCLPPPGIFDTNTDTCWLRLLLVSDLNIYPVYIAYYSDLKMLQESIVETQTNFTHN